MAEPIKWRLDDGQIEVVDDQVAEILRRKTPAEKVAMIGGCNELMRHAVRGGILYQHPEWNEEQLEAAIARRFLGESA